jgi:hypothetical protein
MASEPGNPIFGEIIEVVSESIIRQWEIWNDPKRLYKDADGSMNKLSEKYFRKFETIYPREYFYPFDCTDKPEIRATVDISRGYAVHHWTGMDRDGWSRKDNYEIIKDGMR